MDPHKMSGMSMMANGAMATPPKMGKDKMKKKTAAEMKIERTASLKKLWTPAVKK